MTHATERARRILAPRSTPLRWVVLMRNWLNSSSKNFIATMPTTAPFTSIPDRIRTAVAMRIIAAPRATSIVTMRRVLFLKAISLVSVCIISSIRLNKYFIAARVMKSFGAGTSDIRIRAPARTPKAIAIVRRALALTFCSNASSTPPSLSKTLPSLSATFPILSKFFLKELIHRVNAISTPPPIAPTRIFPMS